MISVLDRIELSRIAAEIGSLEYKIDFYRRNRDALVVRLVADGSATWREIADAAGISNPYIAALKKRAKAHASVSARSAGPEAADA